MAPTGKSWHIPFISKYQRLDPQDWLHVFFLQRLQEEERSQIVQNLSEIDRDWADQLDVPVPDLRKLNPRAWIRDYWPSSNVILEIAKDALSSTEYPDLSYRSLIFVDSGWEAGNVIAAHWEDCAGEMRVVAARVPMNIANLLLTVCDLHEGYALSQVLGDEAYEESKVDFYQDASSQEQEGKGRSVSTIKWPSCLAENLALSKEDLIITSLKHLSEEEIESLLRKIINADEEGDQFDTIKIHNWQGPRPTRADISRIFHRMLENTPEADREEPAFFVDYLLEGENGEPVILAAKLYSYHRGQGAVQLLPVRPELLLGFWTAAASGDGREEGEELCEIWSQELIYDLNDPSPTNFDDMSGAPVFFLQPFTQDEERTIRANLSEKSDIEQEEDWGADWIYFGYPWPNSNEKHSLEDLRDLFESCDPFCPSFNPKSSGPYRFANYPCHFIAVDERALDAEPKVLLVTSLDFHGEEVGDELGWTYGLNEAKEAHLNWVNLDVANMGPADMFDEETKFWLSDLKEYRKNDWTEDE